MCQILENSWLKAKTMGPSRLTYGFRLEALAISLWLYLDLLLSSFGLRELVWNDIISICKNSHQILGLYHSVCKDYHHHKIHFCQTNYYILFSSGGVYSACGFFMILILLFSERILLINIEQVASIPITRNNGTNPYPDPNRIIHGFHFHVPNVPQICG